MLIDLSLVLLLVVSEKFFRLRDHPAAVCDLALQLLPAALLLLRLVLLHLPRHPRLDCPRVGLLGARPTGHQVPAPRRQLLVANQSDMCSLYFWIAERVIERVKVL